MKIKYKHYIIGVASLLGIFCLGNSASAYTTEGGYDDIAGGDYLRYTATCDELDELIENGVPDPHWGYINITLSNDCQKDLVIPSGKKVHLNTNMGSDPWRTLTNVSGDTITVEDNAVLVFSGEATNTTPGKSVIQNAGRLFLSSAHLSGTGDGYVLRNSGVTTAITNTSFNNSGLINSGTLYIAGGQYPYHDVSKYIVSGCSLGPDEAYPDDTVNCGNYRSNIRDAYFKLPEALPDGASIKLESAFPEIANALNMEVISFDSSIVEVTGNAVTGFTLTPKKSGDVWIGGQDFTKGAGQQYSVVYKVENANASTKDYLANNLSDEETHKVVEAVRSDDELYMDLDINQLKQDEVATEYQDLANKEAKKGALLNYYDIYYLLKGRNAGEIARVDDLGDGVDDVVDVAVDMPEGLPEVQAGKSRNFFVVRLHEDGTKTKVDKLDVSKKGDKLHFKSGKFSTYALGYEDVDNISAPNSGVITHFEDGSAQNSILGSILCLATATGALYYISKKQRA